MAQGSYSVVRPNIFTGDVLLFRARRRPSSRGIAAAGRSPYSHAAMAAWWGNRLMALETIQWHGGRAVLLSNHVRHRPGKIDVFGVRGSAGDFDRAKALHAMQEITGRPYGWGTLVAVGCAHLPIVRLFVRPSTDDKANGSLPICSMAVARAVRAGGVDLVPNLADRWTEPGDLARSAALQFICTLWPDIAG